MKTSGVKVKGIAYNVFDDVDWYKFEIKTKSYISFKMDTNNQLVFVYDNQGNLLRAIQNDVDLMNMVNPGTYYIKMRSGNPVGYYELTATIVEYPTENKITSAVYQGSGKVALTWSKSEYADGYYLFYKTSAAGKWNSITTITSGNTTSYTHNYGPAAGQTYYYGIQAYRKDSGYRELYNQEDAEGYKVSAPTSTSDGSQNNSTATPSITSTSIRKVSSKAIEVSWKVKGTASKYQIYWKTGAGSYKLIKTTSKTSYKDTSVKKGKKYSYKIRAYYNNYTYYKKNGAYKTKVVLSKYSKAVSVKR